jgi:hypothetical protein
MPRRNMRSRPFLVRVSHEPGRLERQCMANAFERLRPIVERRLGAWSGDSPIQGRAMLDAVADPRREPA